jgi:hypothetical protein
MPDHPENIVFVRDAMIEPNARNASKPAGPSFSPYHALRASIRPLCPFRRFGDPETPTRSLRLDRRRKAAKIIITPSYDHLSRF